MDHTQVVEVVLWVIGEALLICLIMLAEVVCQLAMEAARVNLRVIFLVE